MKPSHLTYYVTSFTRNGLKAMQGPPIDERRAEATFLYGYGYEVKMNSKIEGTKTRIS